MKLELPHYKNGEYEKAVESFMKAVEKEPEQCSRLYQFRKCVRFTW